MRDQFYQILDFDAVCNFNNYYPYFNLSYMIKVEKKRFIQKMVDPNQNFRALAAKNYSKSQSYQVKSKTFKSYQSRGSVSASAQHRKSRELKKKVHTQALTKSKRVEEM